MCDCDTASLEPCFRRTGKGIIFLLMCFIVCQFFFFNCLVKVEEVPLTPEDLLRVSSLTSNRVTKEMLSKITKEEQAGGLTEMSEKAILVEGDQGRPCILKPGQGGGWKKLCAVYWLPGGCQDVKPV